MDSRETEGENHYEQEENKENWQPNRYPGEVVLGFMMLCYSSVVILVFLGKMNIHCVLQIL